MHAGAGLVHGVERLVGESARGDEAVAQGDAGLDGGVGVGDVVVHLVVGLQEAQDLQRLGRSGLGHLHLLEAAVEGAVLLDGLAELVNRRSADAADLAARQSGLEQIGGVHSPRCAAGAHQRVDLVDEDDDLGMLLELGGDALEALLKLSAIFRAGHNGGDVEHHDAAVGQNGRGLAHSDVHGQTFNDGALAHTGLADEDGVVLLAAAENLLHALDLLLTADDGVHLAAAGQLGEVGGESVQSVGGGLRHSSAGSLARSVHAGELVGLLVVDVLLTGEQVGIEDARQLLEGDAVRLQNAAGGVVLLLEQSQKQMLGVHLGGLHHARLENGQTDETRGLNVHRHLAGLGRHTDEMIGAFLLQLADDGIDIGLYLADEHSAPTAILAQHGQKQMNG